jgi:hypothetical protein
MPVLALIALVGCLIASVGSTAVAKDRRPAAKEIPAGPARNLLNGALGKGSASAGQSASVRGDFNSDGKNDLAVGVPLEDVGAVSNAGAVNVIYGSATGLKAAGNDFWTENDLVAVGDGAQAGDNFGGSLAAGDFDGDGFTDLAIGIPGETVGASSGAGAVAVLYGTASGLTTAGNQFFTEADLTSSDGAESGDSFGASLAAANFGKSARSDLAIGIPFEDIEVTPTINGAGAVGILYGASTGLVTGGNQFITQADQFVEGTANDFDEFGVSLAGANFGRSSQADLAVGVPDDSVGAAERAGSVQVFYGTNQGLTVFGDQLWTQNSDGIKGVSEDTDLFGIAVAGANFGKSAQADLAIGVPLQDAGSTGAAGAVNVIYGGPGGLSAAGNQLWTQNSPNIKDRSEFLDLFGISLASGDFGKSTHADLAIGSALDGIGGAAQAGGVNVLYGSSSGLNATGNQFWTQNSPGIADSSEAQDAFGVSLTAGNYGKGSRDDLTVGVPGEDVGVGPVLNAGAVNVIYGTSTGLSSTGDQFWNQDSAGILDSAETGDEFSSSLGAVNLTV